MGADELGRELYSDAGGQPALRDSIVAFVDELGFSARLQDLTPEALRDDVTRYDAVRSNFSARAGEGSERLRVLYFSDNVGLAMPVNATPAASLAHVLGSVAKYQMELTLGGRFSRGGITRGEIYADYSFITGAALVRAVEIEKKARYPRIVVDQSCVDILEEPSPMPTLSAGAIECRRLLLRDDDKVIVNYLETLQTPGFPNWRIPFVLENHRDYATQGIEHNRGDDDLLAKYRWVAEYHDHFVSVTPGLQEFMIGRTKSRFAPL